MWLKLPRFKIESDISLNQPINNLGIKQLFSGGLANISDEPLWVSGIKQTTFVKVDEEGTVATTATRARVTGASIVEPERFFADRPFLFLIMERSSGLILFIGRIDEPRE